MKEKLASNKDESQQQTPPAAGDVDAVSAALNGLRVVVPIEEVEEAEQSDHVSEDSGDDVVIESEEVINGHEGGQSLKEDNKKHKRTRKPRKKKEGEVSCQNNNLISALQPSFLSNLGTCAKGEVQQGQTSVRQAEDVQKPPD